MSKFPFLFLFVLFSNLSFSQVEVPSYKNHKSITRMVGSIPVEGKNPIKSSISLSSISSDKGDVFDSHFYAFEEVTVYVFGKANLTPCDIPRKKKRFLRRSKRWTERRQNEKNATEIPKRITLSFKDQYFNLKLEDKDKQYLKGELKIKDLGGFDKKTSLKSFVNDDFPCPGISLSSYLEFKVVIDVNSRPRFEKIVDFLEKESTVLSIPNLTKWIDPRLKNKYGSEIVNKVVEVIDKKKMAKEEKISILEYLAGSIGTSDPNLNKVLGGLYLEDQNYLKCEYVSSEYIKRIQSKNNKFKLHATKYALDLAEVFEVYAHCSILKDQGQDEVDLNKAYSSLEQSAKYYFLAQKAQNYLDIKLQQIRLLKKINNRSSLEKALQFVSYSLNDWDQVKSNHEMVIIDSSRVLEIKEKWKIESPQDLSKIVQRSNGLVKFENKELRIEADEIIFNNHTGIYISNSAGIDSLLIKAPYLIWGDEVKIQYSPKKLAKKTGTPSLNYPVNQNGDVEFQDTLYSNIWKQQMSFSQKKSYDDEKEKFEDLLKKKYNSSIRQGNSGLNGDTLNMFVMNFQGGIKYLGKEIQILSPGQNAGEGQNGSKKFKVKYVVMSKDRKQSYIDDIEIEGGKTGQIGFKGKGGTVRYAFHQVKDPYSLEDLRSFNDRLIINEGGIGRAEENKNYTGKIDPLKKFKSFNDFVMHYFPKNSFLKFEEIAKEDSL